MRRRWRGSSLFYDAEFQGSLQGATGTFTGDISGASGTFDGTIAATGVTAGAFISGVTMSADELTAGTIDAGVITVTNLDASNISTGTFSANFISGGTISADLISGGTLSGQTISGGTIDIGGADATSFHVDTTGRLWLGASTWNAGPFRVDANGNLYIGGSGTSAPFKVTTAGVVTATSITLTNPTVTNPTITNGQATSIDIDGSATVIATGQLASGNYSAGVSGWAIDGDGDAEFNTGTFRGAIVGSTIDIGGADATSFHVDATGQMWSGAGTFVAAPFSVSADGDVTMEQAVVGSAGLRLNGPNGANFSGTLVGNTYIFGDSILLFPNDTTSAPARLRLGAGGGGLNAATAHAAGLYPTFLGMFHDQLNTAYMMMCDGAITYIGADSGIGLRPRGNGGGTFEIDSVGGTNQIGCFAGYGNATNPAYSFTSRAGTGIWSPAASTIAVSTNSVERLKIDTTALTVTLPARLANGTAGAPSFSFTSDNNTGIYSGGANVLAFTTGGVIKAQINIAATTLFTTLFLPNVSGDAALFQDLSRFSSGGNEVFYQSSSIKLKADVRDMTPEYGTKLLNSRLVTYDAIKSADGKRHKPNKEQNYRGNAWDVPGTIAEEMHYTFPEAVVYDEDDQPVGVNTTILLHACIDIVQRDHARIEALEAQVAVLSTP